MKAKDADLDQDIDGENSSLNKLAYLQTHMY